MRASGVFNRNEIRELCLGTARERTTPLTDMAMRGFIVGLGTGVGVDLGEGAPGLGLGAAGAGLLGVGEGIVGPWFVACGPWFFDLAASRRSSAGQCSTWPARKHLLGRRAQHSHSYACVCDKLSFAFHRCQSPPIYLIRQNCKALYVNLTVFFLMRLLFYVIKPLFPAK